MRFYNNSIYRLCEHDNEMQNGDSSTITFITYCYLSILNNKTYYIHEQAAATALHMTNR